MNEEILQQVENLLAMARLDYTHFTRMVIENRITNDAWADLGDDTTLRLGKGGRAVATEAMSHYEYLMYKLTDIFNQIQEHNETKQNTTDTKGS